MLFVTFNSHGFGFMTSNIVPKFRPTSDRDQMEKVNDF